MGSRRRPHIVPKKTRNQQPRLRTDPAAGCEALEPRTLFSTLAVNTTADQLDVASNATTVGATVSLRDAVIVATNLSGATEIDLPAGTYNMGNVGTGELQVGNIAGQNIQIKGLGTPANTIIHQSVVGNRIFNFDNNQSGNVAGTISNVTIENATNVNRAFGGGAILAGGPGDSLTLNNCILQNNSTTNGATSVARNGGAIGYSGGGNLMVLNCQFLNNTAGGNATAASAGGAISYINFSAGNLTISNSTFAGNSSTGSSSVQPVGGALQIAGMGSAAITSTTFMNNSAGPTGGAGGAIYASSMTINIAKSRFVDDTATNASGIDNAGATLTANDNWWGADGLPGSPGTDAVTTTGGTTTISTRLALTLSPVSASIASNSSTNLTADIVSTSAPMVALAGTALEGVPLTFAPGSLGSVSPVSVAISNGSATTTFSSGATSGPTSPSVSLDNGTKLTTITIVGTPVANAQSVTVAQDSAKAITLTGSDPNTPPRTLTYTVTASPTHGSLTGTAPNLTYTPNAGYSGPDSFQFKNNNGTSDSSVATVSITVAAAISLSPATLPAGVVGQSYNQSISSTGGTSPVTLVFGSVTNPTAISLSGSGTGAITVSGTPTSAGTVTFTVTASDASGPARRKSTRSTSARGSRRSV